MNDIAPAGRFSMVRYTGAARAFRAIIVRGAFLELVTFGFYRFWLTTEMRRHLWGGTSVAGDAMEYTGRGRELLLGFLIALAVLTPLFLGSFLVALLGGPVGAVVRPLFSVFYYLLWQFAIYRARRYRLTRTVWRGVRFWMTGSGWAYAVRSVLWGVVSVLTLGIAYPWRMAALERYKLRHTMYGTLQGGFAGTGWGLFKRVWWICLMGLIAALTVVLVPFFLAFVHKYDAPATRWIAGLWAPLTLVSLICLVGLPFLHAMRKAAEWRWWADGIRFGTMEVACDLPRDGLVGVYWSLIGLVVLFAAGFLAVALAGIGMDRLGHATDFRAPGQWPVLRIVLAAVWYLALLLSLGAVVRICLMQGVWLRVANACRLRNADALDDVTAAGAPVGALGEGLADGLDFAGF